MSSTIDGDTLHRLAALNKSEIARRIGLSRETISNWSRIGWHIPAEWVVKFEAASGIPREKLRPDLYR